MPIAINVITTANRTCRFTQQDDDRIHEIFSNVGRCAQLFLSRVLIFASSTETEIFSPSSITRIEIETSQDLTEFLPKLLVMGKMTLSALTADAVGNTPESRIDDEHIAGRVDFFFEGGDRLPVWMEGMRASDPNERMMNLTKLFEQPVLIYKLPQGGIGLMNPSVMTRAVFHSGALTLPASAWRVEPV